MIAKDLFKSQKFIVFISMMSNVLLILIGSFLFDSNYIHLELFALLPLSLLLGPFSILGFTIVEVVYWVLFLGMNDVVSIILSASSLLVLGIMPWKLWYTLKLTKPYEIPNMNSFFSFIKIIVITFITLLLTYLFCNQVFNSFDLYIESYYLLFILGLVMLLLGMGIFGRLNIAVYEPVQLKRFMPDRVYDLSLLLSVIVSLLSINHPSNLSLFVTLLLSAVFLIKPLDDEVFKIDTTRENTMFYKVIITIFIILIVIPTVLLLSSTIIGGHHQNITSEFVNYLGILSGFFLAILIPLIIYMWFLENQVINPINQLSEYLVNQINDDTDLTNLVNNLNLITVNNEIKSLSESLLSMEREYVDYSANLLDVTKEKERYETELKLAHEIQYSMIPTNFEEFNQNSDVSLWGSMKAARDVGGDFYDYFKIDEDNIGLVIGDVSGKGVSTALIMVKAMTLIRDYATYYGDLSDVINEINREFCNDDVEGLLIGCWLGKLNTKTGELSYVNAGHEKPLIRQNGADFEFMDEEFGVYLATNENVHYEKHSMHLNSNDTLFLYTDGFTEADDSNIGVYGEEMLQKILNQNKDNELSDIINVIEKDISEFSNNQEQFDDITMLIIKMD